MPTSDAQRRSPLNRLLVVVLALAALIALDVALTLVLEPYGSNSDSVWYEYRQATAQGQQFDTLVIGSSVAQDSLQPGPLDQTLQTSSFCLASPGQSLKSSYQALRVALDEHPVRRVILGTSYTQLAEEPWANSNMAFVQAMAAGRPLTTQVSQYARLLLDPDYVGTVSSIAFLAPFTLSHVDYTPSAIAGNVRNRLECATPLEAQQRIDPSWNPLGKGYANYTGQVNPETLGANFLGINHLAYLGLGGKGLNQSEMQGLEDICRLCQERGVELVVFAAPHPRFEVLSIADVYPQGMAKAQELVTSHGGLFFDFNMAYQDLYDIWESDFIDATHLNMQGAERFSPVFADVVRRAEAGEDVASLFFSYDQWDGYLASLTGVYYVCFEQENVAEGISLQAIAYAGSACQLEFSFETQNDDGLWRLARDWSDDPVCLLSRQDYEGYRTVNVRVMARQHEAVEPERYHYQTVTFL